MSAAPSQICHFCIPAPDMEATAIFYEKVFNWSVQRNVPAESYWFFSNGDGYGGAFTPAEPNPDGLSFYLEVAEIDDVLKLAEKYDGETVIAKEHLGDGYGWRGALLDPCGNLVNLHTAEREGQIKAQAGDPAPISHISIPSKDMLASAKFYQGMFGWEYHENVPDVAYWFWNNGDGHGGGFDTDAEVESELMRFFVEVPDIDEKLALVESLGGKIVRGKQHIGKDLGFDAMLLDPAGNAIGLHTSERKSE